jgi:hypothetical protein
MATAGARQMPALCARPDKGRVLAACYAATASAPSRCAKWCVGPAPLRIESPFVIRIWQRSVGIASPLTWAEVRGLRYAAVAAERRYAAAVAERRYAAAELPYAAVGAVAPYAAVAAVAPYAAAAHARAWA